MTHPFTGSPSEPEAEKKPRKPKSKIPVSSFGPELLAALIRGAAEPFTVVCPTSAIATKLVHRLYTLRKRMREEHHPQANLAQRCKITNQIGGRHTEVIRFAPHDYEYRSMFAAAGVATRKVTNTLLSDLAAESNTKPEDISNDTP